jgi:hypothetical protein
MNQRRRTDHMDRGHWALRAFAYGTLTLVAALLVLIGVWLWYPYQTVSKSPDPLRIAGPHTVRQGGVIVYEYSYTKYTSIIPTIHRQFVDGLIFESTDTATHVEPGTGHVQVAVPVPETLPPGKYHIAIYISYRMNPLRDIQSHNITEDFTVLSKDDHPDESQDASDTALR